MQQLFLSVLFAGAMTAGTIATAAETEEERAVRCAAQANVVNKAVALRLEDKREKRARRLVMKDATIAETTDKEHVELLVNWVYQLPEEQLGEQTSLAFEMACKQFAG